MWTPFLRREGTRDDRWRMQGVGWTLLLSYLCPFTGAPPSRLPSLLNPDCVGFAWQGQDIGLPSSLHLWQLFVLGKHTHREVTHSHVVVVKRAGAGQVQVQAIKGCVAGLLPQTSPQPTCLTTLNNGIQWFIFNGLLFTNHHHHHQKAFRNKSHTSHGHRPGLKRNKSKGKRLTIN